METFSRSSYPYLGRLILRADPEAGPEMHTAMQPPLVPEVGLPPARPPCSARPEDSLSSSLRFKVSMHAAGGL